MWKIRGHQLNKIANSVWICDSIRTRAWNVLHLSFHQHLVFQQQNQISCKVFPSYNVLLWQPSFHWLLFHHRTDFPNLNLVLSRSKPHPKPNLHLGDKIVLWKANQSNSLFLHQLFAQLPVLILFWSYENILTWLVELIFQKVMHSHVFRKLLLHSIRYCHMQHVMIHFCHKLEYDFWCLHRRMHCTHSNHSIQKIDLVDISLILSNQSSYWHP